jgi:hypothetical protein
VTRHFVLMLAVLAVIAGLSPEPWYHTDREQYQQIGRSVIFQDCSALHCFRPLVPAVLEHLPGPSLLKWKTYAVLANWAAAVAVAFLTLTFGLTQRTAVTAAWLSALGFGCLFTLFDPYSADPLMFAAGPALTLGLLRGRLRGVGVASAIGVLGKEFAAAPLWIWTGASVLARRWPLAARTAAVAFAVTTVWLLLQVTLMVGFNNDYGGNPSANLAGGGYIVHWFRELGWRVAVSALVTEFGPLYILAPLGFLWAPAELRRVALAAIPALLVFCYVQQPDRALWNFHYLVTPLAALTLAHVPMRVVLSLVALFALVNLRSAAQFQVLPSARYALLLSWVVATVAAYLAWRGRTQSPPIQPAHRLDPALGFTMGFRVLTAAAVLLAGFLSLVLIDMAAHRAEENDRGLNRHGYRGPVLHAKAPGEIRLLLLGGATTASPHLPWAQSLGGVLTRLLGQPWRWKEVRWTSVADLSQPNDTVANAIQQVRHYRHLGADVVVLMSGYNDLPGIALPEGGRQTSAVFRATGYLPVVGDRLSGRSSVPPAPALPVDADWAHANYRSRLSVDADCDSDWRAYCDAVQAAIDAALQEGCRVFVVSEPYRSAGHFAQQQALRTMIAHRYRVDDRVQYLDLGWHVDVRDPRLMTDQQTLTAYGIEEYVDGLATALIAEIQRW